MNCRRLLQFVLLFGALASAQAHAWENHALGTSVALSELPEVRDAAKVRAEKLERFLVAEQAGLAQALGDEESWDRAHVPSYPARPDSLAFAVGDPETVRERFLKAIRINLDVRLPLFHQEIPGRAYPKRARLEASDVSLLYKYLKPFEDRFTALEEGEELAALDVITTASDEPDYGLDMGVWEDNGTEFGKTYGFGKQPIGDPRDPLVNDAAFHMGFFHEAKIVYDAAGFLKRMYPEYRVHLYGALARFAFRTGHPYWGWRFAGWAVHYVEDMTQPYHSTALPGVSVAKMLWLNGLDVVGIHGPLRRLEQLVQDRHFALEARGLDRLTQALGARDLSDPLVASLADAGRDRAYPEFGNRTVRDLISQESHDLAKATSKALGKEDVDPCLVTLLGNFGTHARGFVRSLF